MKALLMKRKKKTFSLAPIYIVKRKFTSYPVTNTKELKIKMLNWSKQFSIFCLLDDEQYDLSKSEFEYLVGAGALKTLQLSSGNAFTQLQEFVSEQKDWALGHLSYDLKNEVEELNSSNFDGIQFPDLFFFIPEVLLILKNGELKIGTVNQSADEVYNELMALPFQTSPSVQVSKPLKNRLSKENYVDTILKLQKHILLGDCYEINYCQEFYAEEFTIDPIASYLKLIELSPNPFSGFYKLNDNYLLCASPERFIKKKGDKIISQPIKGTAKRDLKKIEEDEKSKAQLLNSPKERSENVMITDLVRNDLSKIAKEGSVRVEELFGIYSFPQVHQMISTVAAESATDDIGEILHATFPMGSMTGAPKKRVMELIEGYEETKRGIFSGALGYITPKGEFDFNVVIRSIMYNAANKYLSIQAGSAITFYSNPEDEYEECLLKVSAMKKAVS
jgi:para-aminobenzoate synthetase component I